MATLSILAEQHLYRFLEEHGNNRVKRELLDFWGAHPSAKFSRLAIYSAMDYPKRDMERALKDMLAEGIVDMHICRGLTLYSLTINEERCQPILELAALGRDQWLLMVRHMGERDEVTKCQCSIGSD